MLQNNDFKNKMMDKIKLYSDRQYLEGYIRNEFLTSDNDADIFLNISDKDELFDTWTTGNQLDLENDVYDFIEEKTSMLDSDIPINLHIIGIEFNSLEQEKIKHILKEHYAIELYKVQKIYKMLQHKIISLFLIGICSLLCYLVLYLFTDFSFFLEVFGFVFSFALWEAFDSLIYSFSEIRIEREAVTQNLLINVTFDNDKDMKE